MATATTAARSTPTSLISWEKAQQQLKTGNKKTNPLLTIGIGALVLLGLAGMWRMAHQKPAMKFVEVVVAKRDIPAGVRLGFTKVSFLQVPKQYITADMITSLNDVSGRITRTYVPAGEPIQAFMLFSGHNGLSASLETDQRAMTLQLDDDALVDHSIQPDDRVDLLVVSSCHSKKYTKTICQDVPVLMTSPREQALAHGLNVPTNKITLAVMPYQSELITEGIETGKIRLVLRSRLSRVEQNLKGASPDDVLPAAAKTPDTAPMPTAKLETKAQLLPLPPPPTMDVNNEPPAGPLQWMVEVFMGSKKETYGVPEK
jgi:Flp pilus assembly protein CpaB